MKDNGLNTPNKFDIQLSDARVRELGLERLLGQGRLELKTETWQWRRTGNLCVEFRNRDKPSGIDAPWEFDAWVHMLCDDAGEPLVALMFPRQRLRALVEYCLDRGHYRLNGGDDHASDNAIIPLKLLVYWLMKNGKP